MLKSYSLEKVKNVLILNSTVAREVNEALRKSFLARQQEPEDPRRELTVFLAGQDARKVRVSTSPLASKTFLTKHYRRSLTSLVFPLGTPRTALQSLETLVSRSSAGEWSTMPVKKTGSTPPSCSSVAKPSELALHRHIRPNRNNSNSNALTSCQPTRLTNNTTSTR